MKKFLKIIVLVIFIMNCFVVNSQAIKWDAVEQIRLKEGTPVYKSSTGNQLLKTAEGEDIGLEEKDYDVIDYSEKDRRFKVEFSIGFWFLADHYEGWVNASEVIEYLPAYSGTDRPDTIEDFIREYNVESINSNDQILAKIDEHANKLKEEDPTIQGLRTDMHNYLNSATSGITDKNQIKQNAENSYNDAVINFAVQGDDDDRFMMVAYAYAYVYKNNDRAEQIEEGLTDGNGNAIAEDDYEGKFNAARDEFNNATTDEERSAALTLMEEAFNNMNRNDVGADDYDTYAQQITDARGQVQNDMGDALVTADDNYQHANHSIYYPANISTSGDSADSLEDMMNDAGKFITSSNNAEIIKQNELQSTISILYNIFLEVGVALAVIIGLVLGIKFMIGSIEEKAEIKKLLVPYIIGCLVVFGAFGIWKFVLTLMETV